MEAVADWRVVYCETLAAYKELARAADRLRLVVLAPEDALPPARLRALVSHDLREFAARVRAHFLAEATERGPERKPEIQARLARLRDEHAPLEARLEALCGEAPGPELREDLLALLDDLAAHESEETRILQESLLRDTGTGD
jgi:hypothetical protein